MSSMTTSRSMPILPSVELDARGASRSQSVPPEERHLPQHQKKAAPRNPYKVLEEKLERYRNNAVELDNLQRRVAEYEASTSSDKRTDLVYKNIRAVKDYGPHSVHMAIRHHASKERERQHRAAENRLRNELHALADSFVRPDSKVPLLPVIVDVKLVPSQLLMLENDTSDHMQNFGKLLREIGETILPVTAAPVCKTPGIVEPYEPLPLPLPLLDLTSCTGSEKGKPRIFKQPPPD